MSTEIDSSLDRIADEPVSVSVAPEKPKEEDFADAILRARKDLYGSVFVIGARQGS